MQELRRALQQQNQQLEDMRKQLLAQSLAQSAPVKPVDPVPVPVSLPADPPAAIQTPSPATLTPADPPSIGQEKEATVLEAPLDEVQAPSPELPAMASAVAETPPSSLSFVEAFPEPEAPLGGTVPVSFSFSVPQTIEEVAPSEIEEEKENRGIGSPQNVDEEVKVVFPAQRMTASIVQALSPGQTEPRSGSGPGPVDLEVSVRGSSGLDEAVFQMRKALALKVTDSSSLDLGNSSFDHHRLVPCRPSSR